jgi:lipopolysaccharide transport system permease protein
MLAVERDAPSPDSNLLLFSAMNVSTAPQSGIALYDFVWTLVRTDFKVRYHGAVGGFVWALLKPIAMFVVLFRVFHFLFPSGTYMMSLLVGLFLWQFFAEGTTTGLGSMVDKRYLITQVSFPRWIVVVASLSNALITLLVFDVGLLIIAFGSGRPVGAACVLLFVVYQILYVLIVVGIALGGSVIYPKYRDLNQVWDVVLQAGFFLAPIVYPLDVIPVRYHFWLYAWPVTPIIEFSRAVLVEGAIPSLRAHLMLVGVTLFIFAVGVVLFQSQKDRAMEKL